MNLHRPSLPTALAGAAALLAGAALAVSITVAATQPPTPTANAFYSAPGAIPELTVNIACAPGTDHGTATVYIAPHSSGALWRTSSTRSARTPPAGPPPTRSRAAASSSSPRRNHGSRSKPWGCRTTATPD